MFGHKLSIPSSTYKVYYLWCSENGLEPLAQKKFVHWLKEHEKKYGICYDTHVRNEDGKPVRGFKGMKASI